MKNKFYMSYNLNKYHLLVLSLIFIFFALHSLYLTSVTQLMIDEPWYANTAYNFSVGNGFVNTVPGGQGGDDLFGFTLLLGVFYYLFGASLLISRIFTILLASRPWAWLTPEIC